MARSMFSGDTANSMPLGQLWSSDGLGVLYPLSPPRILCIKMTKMRQLKEKDT